MWELRSGRGSWIVIRVVGWCVRWRAQKERPIVPAPIIVMLDMTGGGVREARFCGIGIDRLIDCLVGKAICN